MKNVDEMEITQKISELQSCLERARVGAENPGSPEYEFLINSKLGDSQGEKLSYYSVLLKNAAVMFGGGLNNLDVDVRAQTVADFDAKITDALLSFPGYERNQERSIGGR